MKPVTMYVKPTCGFCKKALLVLNRLNPKPSIYQIDISKQPGRRPEMIERSGGTTVPQIFFGEKHIGGCDDLVRLQSSGKLEEALK